MILIGISIRRRDSLGFYIVFTLAMIVPMCFPYVGTPNLSREQKKSISLVLFMIMLLFVSGLRAASVGADTRQYTSAFDQLKSLTFLEALKAPISSWNGYFTYSLEQGYRVYNKIVAFFGGSSQAITFCNSLFIVILLYKLIKEKSPYYGLSIWLYITLGFFQTEMNMARNAIAILLCLCATKYIPKHELLKYILVVLLASTFHTTALVFIPLYWVINYIELTPKRLKILALLSAVGGLFWKPIYNLLFRIIPSRYERYLVFASTETEGIALIFLFLTIFILIWFFCDLKKDPESFVKIDNTGAWLFILMILAFSISRTVSAFTRVAALFSPYLIVYFPKLISSGISNQRNRRIAVVALICCVFIVYIYRLSINNIGKTVPYAFCWENVHFY